MIPIIPFKLTYSFIHVTILIQLCCNTYALQNFQLFPPQWNFPSIPNNNNKNDIAVKLENELLDAIANVDNRLSNDERIVSLINSLEDRSLSSSSLSIKEPAIAKEIYGKWKLLYTTSTDTSSPIQRRAVNAQQFPIYQDIVIVPSSQYYNTNSSSSDADSSTNDKDLLVVKQIVKFTDTVSLSVDALASTARYPLEELQPRQSTGKVFGLNLLGVSFVGEEALPDINRPNSRIDFVFDVGNFYIGNTITIPYPVPFRLPILRDWVKGWIDITYLSNRLRVSKGNKGTTFVLLKEE
jgi:hypothetical protein